MPLLIALFVVYVVATLWQGRRTVAAVEPALRLQEARRLLVYGASAADVADPGRWAAFPRLEPAALSVVGREVARTLHIATPTPNDYVVIVAFEEEARWVSRQEELTRAALGEPEAIIDGDDAFEMWDALADLEEHPAPAGAVGIDQESAGLDDHRVPVVRHLAGNRFSVHAHQGVRPDWIDGGGSDGGFGIAGGFGRRFAAWIQQEEYGE